MKRKRAIKLSVIVTAVLALVILSGAACYAANDISKTNVTGLSIENVDPSSVLESGSTQKVKLTFRDNDSHAIENGDQITVSWPESSAAAYFVGYNKTIPLKAKTNSGEIAVGTAAVSKSGATLTFEGIPQNIYSLAGWVEFQVQAWNSSDQENTSEAAITSGEHSVTTKIHRAAAQTDQPESEDAAFYYKNGGIYPSDTGRIAWYLNINNGAGTVVSDTVIEDRIQAGQKLDKSSFKVYFRKNGQYEERRYENIDELNQDYPGSVTCDEAKGTIQLLLNKKLIDGHQVIVNYYTDITDFSRATYENNTTATYHQEGKDAVSNMEENAQVSNISAGAGISGLQKGTLRIVKVIEGTTTPIPGVTFRLTRGDGREIKSGKYSIDMITDEKGQAQIDNLPIGSYQIREIASPDYVVFDPNSDPIVFEIKETDTEGHIETIENHPNTPDPSIAVPTDDKLPVSPSEPVSPSATVDPSNPGDTSGTIDPSELDNTSGSDDTTKPKDNTDSPGSTAGHHDAKGNATKAATETKTSGSQRAVTTSSDSPDTGDTTDMVRWISVLLLSVSALSFVWYRQRKNN